MGAKGSDQGLKFGAVPMELQGFTAQASRGPPCTWSCGSWPRRRSPGFQDRLRAREAAGHCGPGPPPVLWVVTKTRTLSRCSPSVDSATLIEPTRRQAPRDQGGGRNKKDQRESHGNVAQVPPAAAGVRGVRHQGDRSKPPGRDKVSTLRPNMMGMRADGVVAGVLKHQT